MPRFTFDRERPLKKHRLPNTNPEAFGIRDKMRGDRAGPIKTKVAAAKLHRRNVPVTLAGKYGVDTDEP